MRRYTFQADGSYEIQDENTGNTTQRVVIVEFADPDLYIKGGSYGFDRDFALKYQDSSPTYRD